MTGAASSAAPSIRPTTWIIAGALLCVDALWIAFVYGGWAFGLAGIVQAASFLGALLSTMLPLALAFLAVGLRPEDSIVSRTPLGVAAMFVVALGGVVAVFTGGGIVVAALQGAGAVVALIVIYRERVIPLWLWGLSVAAVAVAMVSTAAQFAVSMSGPDAVSSLYLSVLTPLILLAALVQMATGLGFILARRVG